jgi:hypothetical protein
MTSSGIFLFIRHFNVNTSRRRTTSFSVVKSLNLLSEKNKMLMHTKENTDIDNIINNCKEHANEPNK